MTMARRHPTKQEYLSDYRKALRTNQRTLREAQKALEITGRLISNIEDDRCPNHGTPMTQTDVDNGIVIGCPKKGCSHEFVLTRKDLDDQRDRKSISKRSRPHKFVACGERTDRPIKGN